MSFKLSKLKLIIITTIFAIIFIILDSMKAAPSIDPLRVKKEALDLELSLNRTIFANESYSLTPTSRKNKNINIAITIVYTEGTPLENYATALNSVECYAKLHAYPFHLFSDAKFKECTKHKDLFFRRHCCIVRLMEKELVPDSWILVLDGDIAILHPHKLIEQYIDPNYEITLFDRFFNFEVGANSYLVKNTARGRDFVQRFANYEFKLPKSFHGTDNGALHPYLVELLAPENARIVNELCAKIWRTSKNYRSLYDMEVCTRLIFGDRTHFPEQKLRILPKGKAWVRDLWLLKNRWADDDFMLHAVKEKQLAKIRPEIKNVSDSQIYQWDPTQGNIRVFPLIQKLNISKCEIGEEQWMYDTTLKISNEKKSELLANMEKVIFKKRLQAIGKMASRL